MPQLIILCTFRLQSHTQISLSRSRDESPDAIFEFANLSCPGACDLTIIFLGHLFKSLLAIHIAIWQNPWRVLGVHELLGNVAYELRVVLLGEGQRLS
uniref:Uncharacterized protein n=1 Tax=Arundo donax TaxID=35708 RepID=A0A0A9EXN6_ARUDO